MKASRGSRRRTRKVLSKSPRNRGLSPITYEFQDFVAALLRGMGYFTPFISPKGKDGGVDVIAYKDPIGSVGARIKVQVKHRANSKVTSKEVRELSSLLNKQNELRDAL